jgi:succinyl-diaminopimelate desuccinylase
LQKPLSGDPQPKPNSVYLYIKNNHLRYYINVFYDIELTTMASDVLAMTRTLVQRASVTPEDAGCQALMAEWLTPLGFQIEHLPFGEVTNLWARRGAGGPVLCFAGHTDVVPAGPLDQWKTDPFGAEVIEGNLFGRGSADMKASLAAMVAACRRFVAAYPDHPGSLAFLITSDEEGPARDGTLKVMETLRARNEHIDWCVIGEPSSTTALGDTVRIGRRGSLSGILTIKGIQGHVAYPQLADNPIHAFGRLVAALTEHPLDEGNRHFPPTSFQVVRVSSDAGAVNVTPGELHARFNFRYSTEWTHETLQRHVDGLIEELDIDCDLRWHLSGEPFLTPEGRLSAAVSQAVEEVTGLRPELSTSGGTSDGRFISPAGVDVVEVGPVNETIHKVNEHIRVEDIGRLEAIYFRIAELLLVEGISTGSHAIRR